MGWVFDEHPSHEGYVAALVKDEARGLCNDDFMRQLGYPHDSGSRERVDAVQSACTCGWRGERRHAPRLTPIGWFPFTAHIPEAHERIEDELRAEWVEHTQHVAARAAKKNGRAA